MRIAFVVLAALAGFVPAGAEPGVAKTGDVVIYRDPQFYAAFPSIVRRADGELIVAFRRAPDRRVFGESGNNHVDPNSYLVLVRSKDNGQTWSQQPELILAHPFGGSQDPCMLQLNDGSIVCSSYGWARVDDAVRENFSETLRHGNFVFMGGYLVRSEDGGKTWTDPILPPSVPGNAAGTVFGTPSPAYNRGAMTQDEKGRIYWAVASPAELEPRRTEVHLMTSDDGGLTWQYRCPIAKDDKVTFNETSLYQTPNGDIVAFMRTANFDDHTVVARSTDGGNTFEPWTSTGWQGHPHYALRLPDNRVFLVYGYRHAPHGVRARVLNAECTDFAEAEEIVLRDDGQGGDLGYPWATLTGDGRILAVYYFHDQGRISHIAGTFLEIVK
ncbi:MAG: exo-alpha-sialidase [Candidatus Hydrogenedentes bacterium]|nr:exo-alpha-sialidase [Candidatus Hydrogenedentota bacterium]